MASSSSATNKAFMASIFFLLGLLIPSLTISGAQSVGVCYGKLGNNLPTELEVIDLYKSNGIGKMRIYWADQPALQALKGSNIELIIDVPRKNLQSLTDAGAATDWVQKNIVSFSPDVNFKYIAVGNEIHPGDGEANYVLRAMQNIQSAINSANLQSQIKVSTAIDSSLLAKSYPPSEGVFSDAAKGYITPIAQFLKENGSPLLANIYPFFAYTADRSIDLQYALFNSEGIVVPDGTRYRSLFDAQLDAVYAALEKVNAPDVKIVVSESGWPSEGDPAATIENAGTYNRKLIDHVKGGTPKRPQGPIETYLFAMFDENQKRGNAVEQHFGLFLPDKQPKYGQLSFS